MPTIPVHVLKPPFNMHNSMSQLNNKTVRFKTDNLDLSYLIKDTYDKNMDKLLNQDTPVANLADVKQGEIDYDTPGFIK